MQEHKCPRCDFKVKDSWNYCIICGLKQKEATHDIDKVTLDKETIKDLKKSQRKNVNSKTE